MTHTPWSEYHTVTPMEHRPIYAGNTLVALMSDRAWDLMLALAHRRADRIMAMSPGLTPEDVIAAYRALVMRPGGHSDLCWWLSIVDETALRLKL